MITTLDPQQFQGRLDRFETLISELERSAAPEVLAQVREIIHTLLDVHGAGLERLLDLIAAQGESGNAILDACGRDDAVSGLLLLHDLHPLELEGRLQLALETVQPRLQAHGINAELIGVDSGVVHLRLHRTNGKGSLSAAAMLRNLVEKAVYAKAPEVTAVQVDGLPVPPSVHESNGEARIALPMV